jgi:single-strand DNA-binding protein
MPNIAIVTGFVDSDVRRTTTGGGKKVAEFRVNDGSGWVACKAWEEMADRVPERGAHVIVHGRIATRSYDKDGTKVYVTEVIASVIEQVGAPAAAGAATFDD